MAQHEIVLGGGCFWCLEASFQILQGVTNVVSGYANGNMVNPDYRSVCSGTTGHAEVIKISYDDEIISYEALLEVFFTIHDPTTIDRQGADIGSQYRSCILFQTKEEEKRTYDIIDQMQEFFSDDIVTVVEELDRFYPAEVYHQNYYRNNPTQGYCMAVVAPKINKVRHHFSDKIDEDF